MQPLVSICLATYNGEKYIAEQIESILNQTYKNFELIIQDDKSTDKTFEILKQYEHLPNVTLFQNKTNLGYIKNFESLLQKATGEYIAIADQDDVWHHDKIMTLLQNIDGYSLIYSNSALIDANGQMLGKTLSQKLKNNFISSYTPLNFLYDNSVSAHAILFKKELLPYLTPFPTHLYFDQYIAIVAASLNGVKYIDKNFVLYRQHSTNTLANNSKKRTSLLMQITNKLEKKKRSNEIILKKIQEMQKIPTLSQKDIDMLQTLQNIHKDFEKRYFNIKAFFFFLQHNDILFKITTKKPFLLSIKKSIGYKLYKAIPIL